MALLSRWNTESRHGNYPGSIADGVGREDWRSLGDEADETAGSDATKQEWLVHGRGTVPGRVRYVVTTASDNAATQAAAVLAALRA